MPLGSISLSKEALPLTVTDSYIEANPGRYLAGTYTFGSLRDEVSLETYKNPSAKVLNIGVRGYFEEDIPDGDSSTKSALAIQLRVQVPNDGSFTNAEVLDRVRQVCSAFNQATVLNHVLNGGD